MSTTCNTGLLDFNLPSIVVCLWVMLNLLKLKTQLLDASGLSLQVAF